MRTKYCPHCASEKIHREEEPDGSHYHECEDCTETWEHHEAVILDDLSSCQLLKGGSLK